MSAPVVAVRLRALGDVALCTAALKSLRDGFPGAPLHVVTEPRFAPLLAGQPGIEKVWELERTTRASVRLIGALRELRPALAVDFFGNSRSAVVARGSGARTVWGYDMRGREHLYDHTVPRVQHPGGDRREYAAASLVRLARAAGGADVPAFPQLVLTPHARAAGERALAAAHVADPARTIALVPAGSWPTKTWPLSHIALLALRLRAAGHPLVAIGGPGEEPVLRRLAALVPGLPTLSAPDVAALAGAIAPLRALVGTDSGPRHLAVAFGVPTYTWFGPAHPDAWTPDDPAHGYWRTSLPCRTCELTHCAHWNCLPSLSADEAAERVLAHLARFARAGAAAAGVGA